MSTLDSVLEEVFGSSDLSPRLREAMERVYNAKGLCVISTGKLCFL